MISSGFVDAVVSKTVLFGLVASSVVVSVTDRKHFAYLQVLPHLLQSKQYWRIFSWQLCYTNPTELFFAAITIYHLRILERLWGSRKFLSFLLTEYILTTVLLPLSLTLLHPGLGGFINHLPAGPTPLIFALLAQYHAAIPRVNTYRITASSGKPSDSEGLILSEKSTTYLLASQLAFSQLPGSLLSATMGWTLGLAWRNQLLPAHLIHWRVPGWLFGIHQHNRTFSPPGGRSETEYQSSESRISEVNGEVRQRRGYEENARND